VKQVNVHEAKSTLSKLLSEVEHGEEVVIARAGKPIARLVPDRAERGPREPGSAEGQVRILPGFDHYDKQLTRDFGVLDEE